MPIPGVRGIRTLAREVRRSDALVIHDALYVTSILALLIAKWRSKRVILIQHIAGIPFSSRMLRTVMKVANVLVTRPMLWAADEQVFISETVRQDLLGRGASQSSELLFNGVDGSIFYPPHGEAFLPDAVAPHLQSRGRRVLFVGRYVEKKGLKILRVLAALRQDLDFYLVGSGSIRPHDWGLGNVHDLGPQRQEALADLYRWADLLVLPSVGEGYPLVIQEAMACGLPVVCGMPSDRADPEAAMASGGRDRPGRSGGIGTALLESDWRPGARSCRTLRDGSICASAIRLERNGAEAQGAGARSPSGTGVKPTISLSERPALIAMGALIALKLALLFVFAIHGRFVMDEFEQLGWAKYLGHGFFDTIWPAKAVGYAVFFKLAHLIGWDAQSILIAGRIETAMLACGTIGLVYAMARALGQNRLRALVIVLTLLCFSNFLERSYRTIAEPVATFFAAASLLVVLRGDPDKPRDSLAAGILTGLAFLATRSRSTSTLRWDSRWLGTRCWRSGTRRGSRAAPGCCSGGR